MGVKGRSEGKIGRKRRRENENGKRHNSLFLRSLQQEVKRKKTMTKMTGKTWPEKRGWPRR